MRKSEDTWLKDANNNRCSVQYYGSEEAAKAALDSLINCRDCSDCSDCSGCSSCSYCSYCSGCSSCSYCSSCSSCSYCSSCSGCSYCSDCSYCSYCSGYSGCSDKRNGKDNAANFVPPTIPKIENIHQRIYEAASQPKALAMSDWHACSNTHCRAGWVVHLAGEAGYALERFHNTALAAQLIYRESGAPINPGRFYDSNDAALADMKRLAEATS